jgi:hypothetical protein
VLKDNKTRLMCRWQHLNRVRSGEEEGLEISDTRHCGTATVLCFTHAGL